MIDIAYLIIGILLGGAVVWLSTKGSKAVLNKEVEQKEAELVSLRKELEIEMQAKVEAQTRLDEFQKQRTFIEEELSNKFAALSLEALSKNSAQFLKLAEEGLKSQTIEGKRELESKKELIDQSLEVIAKTLSDVQKKIDEVGKGSGEKFVEVATLIKKHEELTSKLKDTTEHLSQALASSKKRGEWGERMAEDIIKLVGLVEGISYIKQKTMESSSGRPDYTFFLPNNLKINMDVKFPIDNYMHYLNA